MKAQLARNEVRGALVSSEATMRGNISVLHELLEPIFEKMPMDRLYRAAHEENYPFAGRPHNVSSKDVMSIAKAKHEERRARYRKEVDTRNFVLGVTTAVILLLMLVVALVELFWPHAQAEFLPPAPPKAEARGQLEAEPD